MRCTGTPISWLRLERYHQGDEAGASRAEIAAHLGECEACAACLAQIADDDRALVPLRIPPRKVIALPRVWYAAGAMLAAAAVFVLVFWALRRKAPDETPDETMVAMNTRPKGGEVSFALVHETRGALPEGGATFLDGDRFKIVVTCPPDTHAHWDVAVYEGTDVSFPLAPTVDLACGNQVALPGAFRVTGRERMTVCLVWSEQGPVDRQALRLASPADLPQALCEPLEPEH
jgi:hypothetical protein